MLDIIRFGEVGKGCRGRYFIIAIIILFSLSISCLVCCSMNYIWGAVNAISAPYQYYKELPPINPATLTGAIDVIVIRRPGPDGGTHLACSPFHVRFGKWQVLRPAEKKVRSYYAQNHKHFRLSCKRMCCLRTYVLFRPC